MSWYFMVDTYINEERGRSEYDDYIRRVKPIVEAHGGRYLVRTEQVSHLSGERTPQRAIVIRFDTREQLDTCFASPEYRAIMAKRAGSVDSRAIVAEGLD